MMHNCRPEETITTNLIDINANFSDLWSVWIFEEYRVCVRERENKRQNSR